MVTFPRIALLVAACVVAVGYAIAEPAPGNGQKPQSKPAATSAPQAAAGNRDANAAVRQAQAAAAAASAAQHGSVDGNTDFLTDQALRAQQIMEEAKRDAAGAAFFSQNEAVQRAQQAQSNWAAEQLARAQQIEAQTTEAARSAMGIEPDKPKPEYKIFVSQSMGPAALRAAFELGRGRPDVMYVFRGFNPGQSPMALYKFLATFQGKTVDEIVQIALDPPAFQDAKITQVPAIVYYDANERAVAQVRGLINFGWLKERIDAGAKGDLGNRGQVYPISEPDLMLEMQRKAMAIDWKAEGEKARRNYFRNLQTITLPRATESRARKIYPVLTVSEDIRDTNGVLRFSKGQQVSMKDQLPFAPILIVFDSQDPVQVRFAQETIKRADPHRKVILMTTNVDREHGIPGYLWQEAAIGRPVFLLMQDVQQTFGIERVPTVVTPTNDGFVVVEVPLVQGGLARAGSHASQR